MEQWKRYCGGTVARLMTFFSRDKHRNHFSCLESKYWISSHNQSNFRHSSDFSVTCCSIISVTSLRGILAQCYGTMDSGKDLAGGVLDGDFTCE